MTDLVNELINDEAVYKTAPATQGLLNMFEKNTLNTSNSSSGNYIYFYMII